MLSGVVQGIGHLARRITLQTLVEQLLVEAWLTINSGIVVEPNPASLIALVIVDQEKVGLILIEFGGVNGGELNAMAFRKNHPLTREVRVTRLARQNRAREMRVYSICKRSSTPETERTEK